MLTPMVVVDLGYGDAGKGALVDRICAREAVNAVVRFNGGCQAAHNVIDSRGRHHTFSQFGSGTLQGVPSYLAARVCVEPLAIMNEAEALESIGVVNPLGLLAVAHDAKVTTPYHWLVNRFREDQRGEHRHGSTGRGVGETEYYAQTHSWDEVVLMEDLGEGRYAALLHKLQLLRDWALKETEDSVQMPRPDSVANRYEDAAKVIRLAGHEELLRLYATGEGRLVFEGAQGVLLDEHVGFHPYTTWSTVTPDTVLDMLSTWHLPAPQVVGVTRAYSTRHGAGPFVPEDGSLNLPESHNRAEQYQGSWRVGHLDVPALRHAVKVTKPDKLYVTHLDTAYAEPRLQVCTDYIDPVSGHAVGLFPQHKGLDLEFRHGASRGAMCLKPQLEPRPLQSWSHSVEKLLEVDVIGVGIGPTTNDGVWQA